ncbi:methylamine utilization protein [Xylophilus sp. GOD-11R]|uniref:methylamine utilization protein n=1 Tax=Xylophilus sp. GOD-11R TaxID=3089814 RepID=UPI00298D5231|nr:methylamine utilization protein [Xylophilus sp. GOD-11R]WPB57144.1 methylamine utilization protein [Xylophilus sp. GOD-11R]
MNTSVSARAGVRWTAALATGLLFAGASQAAGIAVQAVNARGAALANAVVYAVPVNGKAPALEPGKKAIIDQIDREFVPMVSVIQTGTAVVFPNKDDVEHAVYSFSPPKRFEIKLYSGTPARPVVFDKPGMVTLGCNIHDSMVAYVLIVDTPYFAKTDKSGRATIDNLPAGAYRVVAWHPQQRDPNATATQNADVPAGAATAPPLKFTLAAETN